MATTHDAVFFDPRFCGPPGTVNGGLACGALAARVGAAAEVTLLRPVPVARSLAIRGAGDATLTLVDGGTPLAEARRAPALAPPSVPTVPAELAEEVAGRARYFAEPAFPGCFVCGPERAPGDGLRILPGPAPDGSVWAAPWTPDASVAGADGRVRPEVVWAALDCPSGIAAGEAAGLSSGTAALLGRMTATISSSPRPGQACRVVAWPLARDGRKLAAGSALLSADDAVLAAARTLWITVPRPALPVPTGATS